MGCQPSVGPCNWDEPLLGSSATEVAYRLTDGLPMYEGQALLQQSCGNGNMCHAPQAEQRFGAPRGMDFDVTLACVGVTEACDDAAGSAKRTAEDSRLRANQRTSVSLATQILQQVQTGLMPPGPAGVHAQSTSTWLRQVGGDPLPSIYEPEGREILRNWLACGAPVVGSTREPEAPTEQLATCDGAPVSQEQSAIVSCVVRGAAVNVQPTWDSIYYDFLLRECIGCHGPANGRVDANPRRPFGSAPIGGGSSARGLASWNLAGSDPTDTSNWAAEAYNTTVRAPASSAGACEGDRVLVDPSDAQGSLLVAKLRGTHGCGDVMPPASADRATVATAFVEAVVAWIEAGAHPANTP